MSKIICPHCKNKSKITHRNDLTDTVADLYCTCKNPKCAASFVYVQSYSHTIHPPIKTVAEMALSIIKSLPKEDIDEIKKQCDLFK